MTLGRFFTWFITVYDDHQVIRSGPFDYPPPGLSRRINSSCFEPGFPARLGGGGVVALFQLLAYARRIRYEEAIE